MAWGIIGFGFLLLIVFVVLASKTWNWVDITFVVLIYCVGVFTVLQATDVLQKRYAAMFNLETTKMLAEKNKAEAESAIVGDIESSTYSKGSLRHIDGVLSREMLGRGRVWSGGTVTKEGANRKYTFKTPRTDPFEKLIDVVLYVFADGNQIGENYYIGAVRVESEDNASITFSQEAVVSSQFDAANLSWKLFEKMPLDRRDVFQNYLLSKAQEQNAEASIKGLAAAFENKNVKLNNISDYRDFLREEFAVAKDFFTDVEFEELIDRYAFDGLELGLIQQWINQNPQGRADVSLQRFTPDPQETFIRYEFTSSSKKPGGYIVDGEGSLERDNVLFNAFGLAIEDSLRAGAPVLFKEGDTVLVDVTTDQKGIGVGADAPESGFVIKDEEDVKEIGRVYIRQKRDYPYEFSKLKLRTERLAESIQQYEKNLVTQQKLLEDADKQEQERVRLIAENEEDRVNLEKDKKVIFTLWESKTKEVDSLKQTISSLESRAAAAYQKLRKLAVALSREAFAKK